MYSFTHQLKVRFTIKFPRIPGSSSINWFPQDRFLRGSKQYQQDGSGSLKIYYAHLTSPAYVGPAELNPVMPIGVGEVSEGNWDKNAENNSFAGLRNI